MEIIVLLIFAIVKFFINKEEKENKKLNKDIKNIKDLKENKPVKTRENQGQNLLSGIDNLIKELQEKSSNISKEYPDELLIQEYNQKEDGQDIDNKVETIRPAKSINLIREKEIKDGINDYYISFTEESLIQGIIMSEILDKPKALKR